MSQEGKYREFGILLTKLRQEAGFSQQSDFAKLIKTTQQTVSRWESGISRPRHKKISAIAAVLKANLGDLIAAAGYSSSEITVTSFDLPFPVDALKPDSFERFCLYFLASLYCSADVHRAGDTGHTQNGVDIIVTFPNQTEYAFQCKRVQQFGPEKVHAAVAVAKQYRKAKKKFLLLSRIASPLARAAIRQHQAWDIWDKEDISREIRQNLRKDEQVRLVDTFFPGQRLALLGEREAGPWQTTEEFFEPFMAESGAFSHKWDLIGRIQETENIVSALSDPQKKAVFLVGPGGAGKSRILKEAVDTYHQFDHNSVQIRILSPRREITDKCLEDLGNGRKVLIVDDAHDENNLQLLFQYAAASTNNAKLVLVFRPYGLDYLKAQASCFALGGEHIAEVILDPLTLERTTELASLVLKKMKGPQSAAGNIARLTRDCPLATVIAAQIVATEKISHVELTKNEDRFRTTIFGKFQDIIAGNIGSKGDNELIRRLLKIIAIIQPFHPDDKSVATIVEQVEGVRAHEVNSFIRRLADAGVLFKRGGNLKLAPDLLSDFIIEESCIGHNGASTGYAEKVLDRAGDAHLKNILLNLGKLDWRRTNGSPSNSNLLDDIWMRLKPSQQYSDPCIDAVTSVAYYQPNRAMEFVAQLMREGRYLTELPKILKYTAFNFEHIESACELLWELGKGDNRPLNQHPGHAIRILSEMSAVERNKPFAYNQVVVDFVLSLIDKEDSWNYEYTPFDILNGILKTEGKFTESHGLSISFGSFSINYSFVAPLRKKVLSAALKLLSSSNTKMAVQAARFIHEGLRYYTRSGDQKHYQSWEEAFVKTLKNIEQVIQTKTLDPLVLIQIARSVSWHANHAKNKTTSPIAKKIIGALPNSLKFRTTLALIDGFGRLHERMDFEHSAREWNRHLDLLTKDLLTTYPNGENLRNFIDEILCHVELNFGNVNRSPYILYERLISSSLSLAKATADNAYANRNSKTNQFAGMAFGKLLNEDHEKALATAAKFLAADSRDLHIAIGKGYSEINLNKTRYGEKDIAFLKTVLTSVDEWVAISAVQATKVVAKNDQRLAIDLLKCVDIGMTSKVAENVLIYFQRNEVPYELLTEDDIEHFLAKLRRLQELDEYWIEVFLSKCSKYHAMLTARFFMDRVEHAAEIHDWRYRPCNCGPYCNVPLRFRESPEFGLLLRHVAQWMKSGKKDYVFQKRAAELFEAMFSPFDAELVGFLQIWVDMAMPADIAIISQILEEAPNNFVFEHRPFIISFLEKTKNYGEELLDDAIGALIGCAISGTRSGVPGEPFPQDLEMKENAEKMLSEIPRFSPAYRVYENLIKYAVKNIERAHRDREQFEE